MGVQTSVARRTLFLRACRSEPVERVPVWIMRQAGRYLPEYRAVRAKHSFLEVCKTPELAAEVSLQPVRALGVDAAIVFSDILIVAEAMGMPLVIDDSGPEMGNPVRDAAGIRALQDFDPERETRFVGDAIRAIGNALGPDVPIIGFAAAPWTLACYMVEGRVKGGFSTIRRMMASEPGLLRELLGKIARNTARYLQAQIVAGATAVQLFDTWAGELSLPEYDEFELPAIRLLLAELDTRTTPVILYSKAAGHLLASVAQAGADVLSLDWRIDLADARRIFGPRVALQGNVDPEILLGSPEDARTAARAAIEKTGGVGHILNLGHGILPATPVENARAFVEAGQLLALSARVPLARADAE